MWTFGYPNAGSQTTAHGPNAAREAISSALQSHFVNDEK